MRCVKLDSVLQKRYAYRSDTISIHRMKVYAQKKRVWIRA